MYHCVRVFFHRNTDYFSLIDINHVHLVRLRMAVFVDCSITIYIVSLLAGRRFFIGTIVSLLGFLDFLQTFSFFYNLNYVLSFELFFIPLFS